ncbi:MAG: DUF1801 domain-containing protein [Bacteroidia bacterium]|nr:DUF1801 domain-containing protein [Bacteroidia bacterium]
METIKYNNVEEYITTFPADTQILLIKLRATIKKAAPEAEEVISYNMPAFKHKGILVYFAAYKNHIGFYPTSSGIKAFQNELSEYHVTKGTIQFTLNKPLPIALVTKIVKFRLKENNEKLIARIKKR